MTKPLETVDQVARALALNPARASSDFDLNPPGIGGWPVAPVLREAAVLLPLIASARGLDVILTKRASHLLHHPGQIAFPGGKRDEADRSPEETALREANEEIGLPPESVALIGTMPFHETVTSFRITPVVGHVTREFTAIPEKGEVEEIFRVPLAYLADPANYLVEGRRWGGVKRHYYTVPWGPYYIWGATARILRALADRIAGGGRP